MTFLTFKAEKFTSFKALKPTILQLYRDFFTFISVSLPITYKSNVIIIINDITFVCNLWDLWVKFYRYTT